MNIDEYSIKLYLEHLFKSAGRNTPKNHVHPCCQERIVFLPDVPLNSSTSLNKVSEEIDNSVLTFKCPRGHEYEAPEPFIITTPDLSCDSGPLCIYCYVTWLHINIGTEELVARG